MGRYFCLFTLIVTLAATPRSPAQQSILPDQFAGWRLNRCVDMPNRPALSDEAGQREFRSCEFSSMDRSAVISAGRYRDPSSAYEVYTSLLGPAMSPAAVGQYSAADANKFIVLIGDVVLHIEQPRNIPAADLQQLVTRVKERAHESPLPPIRAFLPEEDLLNGTQRYALGAAGLRNALDPYIPSIFGTQNLQDAQREEYLHIADQIGFSSGAETMLAQYQGNKGSAVLLLIDYPTPQLAELHLRHLQTALPEDASAAKVTIERKGSLLSLVLTSSSPEYADALRQNINLHTQVTWNEPSATATDPPWSVILSRIFIGTGVFMVLAVIFGVLFGGIRVFTKRYFPGKIFDRPKNIEILQLGLSGKPIDPSDFY
jgi:hypothetical protein